MKEEKCTCGVSNLPECKDCDSTAEVSESSWDEGVIVSAGDFTDGTMTGTIITADFSENLLELDCGDGFFWRGTSQEFSRKWESI